MARPLQRLRRALRPRARRRHQAQAQGQAPGRPSGTARADYRPQRDGQPDPGEVCWAWVPYEEDASQGKDRPVLVLAEGTVDGEPAVQCLVLTSKDHDRDAAQEAAAGRYWMDIGTGGWDSQGRPSEVRLNRLVTLPVSSVRREGAALDRGIFEQVIEARARLA